MKKRNDLISKIAIVTAVVGIGSYIYKKIKKSKCSCDTTNPECTEDYSDDDSSFEIILDDDLEEESQEELINEEVDIENTVENENKDA